MPRIKPPPFVRVLAGQRAAARTRSVPTQFTNQTVESNEMRIDCKGDMAASTWTEFRVRRAAMPPAEDHKDSTGEDEAVFASKRKAEWKRRQGVCM
jgi:hypothetical protein